MKLAYEFKSPLSFDEIRSALKELHPTESQGGESWYLGDHYKIVFADGISIKIFDPATSAELKVPDASLQPKGNESAEELNNLLAKIRMVVGYEIEIEAQDEKTIKKCLEDLSSHLKMSDLRPT